MIRFVKSANDNLLMYIEYKLIYDCKNYSVGETFVYYI